MYRIEFLDSAQKEFKQLTKENQSRIISVLERIVVRPHSFALRLSGSKAYRVRAGKLRVILDIIEEKQIILVLKLGNRENIYLP
ncbi:type II toxin-antitoxin system RelE/ParE family toxin [Candidatus Micrarchaeota archaeon]|nr:type II toxin-antitoxin system RelE/ParE family toxin [Candidatus Micrarchaeota archaeon]